MLNQSVGYAITALGYLASVGDQTLTVRDISEATLIPAYYLAKIINVLARKGFVSTQRGIGGGVALAQDPRQVSIYDVCVALDEPMVKRRCMLGSGECCDEKPCPAHPFWMDCRERYLDFLKQTTLHDIPDLETRKRALDPSGIQSSSE